MDYRSQSVLPRVSRSAVYSLAGAMLLCSAAWGPGVLAQEPLVLENTVRSTHWSARQLMSAEPLDLPIASPPFQDVIDQANDQLQPLSGQQVSTDGANVAEEDEIGPDLDARLFPELPPDDIRLGTQPDSFAPQDAGTLGAHFSSSRLIPADARLFYPYRAVGKLFFVTPEGNAVCSAAVLGPRIVLTAGHCVHSGSGGSKGFYSNFLFVPAYHDGQAPYQTWQSSAVITTASWAKSNGTVPNRADFAILVVGDKRFGDDVRRIGDVTGYLGYRTNALLSNHTKKLGYPVGFDRGEIMHQVDSQWFKAAAAETVLYGSDMTGGSSGGPWVENFGQPADGQTGGLQFFLNRIVGVTSYGFASPDPKVQGSSVLNDEFLAILDIACKQQPGNC